jgi:hypothetical protein
MIEIWSNGVAFASFWCHNVLLRVSLLYMIVMLDCDSLQIGVSTISRKSSSTIDMGSEVAGQVIYDPLSISGHESIYKPVKTYPNWSKNYSLRWAIVVMNVIFGKPEQQTACPTMGYSSRLVKNTRGSFSAIRDRCLFCRTFKWSGDKDCP